MNSIFKVFESVNHFLALVCAHLPCRAAEIPVRVPVIAILKQKMELTISRPNLADSIPRRPGLTPLVCSPVALKCTRPQARLPAR